VNDLRRGDIVAFRSPDGSAGPTTVVHRVLALPGETIEARDRRVLVNGRPLNEPYLGAGVTTQAFAAVTVPPGHYWMMGDNRGNSKDSRFYGPVPAGNVEGVVTSILSPAGRVRSFPSPR
jgi:signal peptidase I